jgi:LCP family protein required for cell wall assembly
MAKDYDFKAYNEEFIQTHKGQQLFDVGSENNVPSNDFSNHNSSAEQTHMGQQLFEIENNNYYDDSNQTSQSNQAVSNPEPRRSSPKPKKRKWIKYTLLSFLVIAFAISGYFYSVYSKTKEAINSNSVSVQGTVKTDFAKEPSNILIMGTDENVTGQEVDWRPSSKSDARADTLILVRFDPIKKEITTSSIPRDTAIKNTCSQNNQKEYGYKKINATASSVVGNSESEIIKNGMACMVEEYKANFGITINYIVKINMNVVVKLVDRIGGLDFAPDKNNFGEETNGVIYGQDELDNLNAYTFTAGEMTHFDGKKALSYGRIRYGDSDFFRGARQQEVFKEAIKKMSKNPTIFNDLPSIINDFGTDLIYNFSGSIVDDIILLSKDLKDYKTVQMEKFEMLEANYVSGNVWPPSEENYVLSKESKDLLTKTYK